MFGDSVFAGYGLPANVPGPAEALTRALALHGWPGEVLNVSTANQTASCGLMKVEDLPVDSSTLVLVEFGLNDCIQGVELETTEAALVAIIGSIARRGGCALLVETLVPDTAVWPPLSSHSGLCARVARACGIPMVPDILRALKDQAEWRQSDGLHPSAEGVTNITALLADAIAEIVSVPGDGLTNKGRILCRYPNNLN